MTDESVKTATDPFLVVEEIGNSTRALKQFTYGAVASTLGHDVTAKPIAVIAFTAQVLQHLNLPEEDLIAAVEAVRSTET